MKYLSLIPALVVLFLFPKTVHSSQINLSLVDSSDYFTVKVDITGLEKTSCKDKTCYLQGMFTQNSGSPKYFGQTFGQKDWFVYQSSPEKEFIKSNFPPFESNKDGSWSGEIRLALDKEDKDYKGSGDYLTKVKRYTGESSSAASDDINELTISIIDDKEESTPTVTITPTAIATVNTPTPQNTPTPTQIVKTPSPTPTPSPKVTLKLTETPVTENILGIANDQISTQETDIYIASESASDDEVIPGDPELTDKYPQFPKYAISSGLVLLTVTSSLLYIRLKRVKI